MMFFFFKQKTAYEMRISDWSSDVCSSDLVSGRSPEGWARAVAEAASVHGADRVVAEANNGGAMVESVLRAADMRLPVRLVHASRGRSARAEPVAALYESGRALHCGAFPELEDEMCGLLARSEEHTSELQSLMRTSYDVFCLKKQKHISTI